MTLGHMRQLNEVRALNRFSSTVALSALLAISSLSAQQGAYARDLYKTFSDVGSYALTKPDTVMAEVMYSHALEQAEQHGEADPRVVESATKLLDIYARQNQYVLAQPLYNKLVRIAERHPEYGISISSSLENYSALLTRLDNKNSAYITNQLAQTIRSNASRMQVSTVDNAVTVPITDTY